MTMVRNLTRFQLKQNILQNLGHPIVKVNITDDMLNNCINSAIKKLWRWHYDFSFENYYVVTITDQMVADGFFFMPIMIDTVTDVIPIGSGVGSGWQWATMDFQLNQNTIINNVSFQPLSLTDYEAVQMRMDNYKIALGLDIFRFSYSKFDRKFIPFFPIKTGDKVVLRVIQDIDNEGTNVALIQAGKLFDNETLQDLSTAYAKQMFGRTLSKYEGMTLPSGQVISGQALIDSGEADEAAVMQRMKDEAVDLFFLA